MTGGLDRAVAEYKHMLNRDVRMTNEGVRIHILAQGACDVLQMNSFLYVYKMSIFLHCL